MYRHVCGRIRQTCVQTCVQMCQDRHVCRHVHLSVEIYTPVCRFVLTDVNIHLDRHVSEIFLWKSGVLILTTNLANLNAALELATNVATNATNRDLSRIELWLSETDERALNTAERSNIDTHRIVLRHHRRNKPLPDTRVGCPLPSVREAASTIVEVSKPSRHISYHNILVVTIGMLVAAYPSSRFLWRAITVQAITNIF